MLKIINFTDNWTFFGKLLRTFFRQNRISVATGGRVLVAEGFPLRAGFPRVPLHSVYEAFVGSVLYTGTGLLPRAVGPHATVGKSHVRTVLTRTGSQLFGSQ